MTIRQIWEARWILRSIIPSIYFNFIYLPFKQAIKLPILLYKPRLIKLKGKIIIETKQIKFGMIQLGREKVSLYPNSGIIYENHGGIIVFNGKCHIGNNSAISIGEKGYVYFGDKFSASTTLRLTSYKKIIFKENVHIGWECTFMDTDFHKMTKRSGGFNKGYGEIIIGCNNWFGSKCLILKNTKTPDYCTISSASIISKDLQLPPYCVIGTDNNVIVKAKDVYRDMDNDKIIYE